MQNLPRKFNPGLNQDDKSLISQYVVRLPLLKMLLEAIADNTKSPVCQHRLYYGPRGRGKTMLMTRVAAELRVNPAFFANWIPIRLLEESYYEISNMGEFWLEVMSELTLSLGEEYKEDATLSLNHLIENWSHPNLAQMAQAAVLEQLDKLHKKAVIMIENLHQLIDETGDDFGWEIRRVMQNEPRIMFLVTATTRFDNLDNAKKPFFEIFATTELKRLKRSDTVMLWNSLTQSEKTEKEVAPLDILTGGSPRILNIVAQFAQKNSIRELMENLTGLVDEYTEYFKSQLDALAPKERRVFLALADLWSESTAKEVAERARMDIRTTSALLGRLESKGALKVNAEMPRRKMYAIAERLFCIYYKLRRERSQDAVIEGLVQFMVDFYTPEEIDGIRSLHLNKDTLTKEESIILEKLSCMNTGMDSDVLVDVNEVKSVSLQVKKDMVFIQEKTNEAISAYHQKEFAKAIATFDIIIQQFSLREEVNIIAYVVEAMFNQAVILGQQGDVDKALAMYEGLIKRYQAREEAVIVEQVAKALLNQAVTLGEQGDVDKSLVIYDDLIKRYHARKEITVVECVVMATINQAHLFAIHKNWQQAEDYYQQALLCLDNINVANHDVYTSTASLGQLISEQGRLLSVLQQSCLAEVIKEATQQSASEERMTLAIGMAAVLPAEMAVSIIQKSIGHEALQPLIAALQQNMGEKVRASEEALEVAADVKLRMEEMREKYCS
jgi:tetratricopeptide (TPR) repeat protein